MSSEKETMSSEPAVSKEDIPNPSSSASANDLAKREPTNPSLARAGTNQSRSYSKEYLSAEALYKTLSRTQTGVQGDDGSSNEEMEEIDRLLTLMFGQSRREHSEEEKTRHVGVIFKHLTVKGLGIGAALQPTVADPLHFFKTLFTRGPKAAKTNVPVRTLIDDFSGCIKPSEMVLVLGRPGSGCSTFLKCLANQRFGFEEVLGEVTYGGTDSGTMKKRYRGEILYNPEDDLHYATLKVKDTLSFALTTRTPGKESRREGETRKDYVSTFVKMVSLENLALMNFGRGPTILRFYVRISGLLTMLSGLQTVLD